MRCFDRSLYRVSRKQPPEIYWRDRLEHHSESPHLCDDAVGSLIVLYDSSSQDEAGAELLTPQFTHHKQLGNKDIARAIWNALCRARLENLDHLRKGVRESIEQALENNSTREFLYGELASYIRSDENEHTKLNKVICAVLTKEVLDYLTTGSNMRILHALVQEPVCMLDADSWNAELFAEKLGARVRGNDEESLDIPAE